MYDKYRLKMVRQRKDLTQLEVGRQAGIKEASYKNKENGLTAFSDEEKIRVAKVLGLDAESFLLIFFGGAFPIGNGLI